MTGLDINPVSLQMAAGRMTLGNLSVDYRKMSLRAMPYGPVDGAEVRLGSLELLTDDDVVGSPPDAAGAEQQQGALFLSSAVDPEVVQDVEDRRIVMMNPPFTANDKKGRKFTSEVTKALQRRELQIRDRLAASDPEAAGVIDANSISTMFTPLAEKILVEDGGVLAKILPVTACTGASGLRERRFLASRFHVDLILCSHDPREPNLSTHTSINECLLIARRRGAHGQSGAPTKFVNLRRFPKTVDAVRDVVAAIRHRRIDEVGSVCEWPEDRVRVGDWSPVQWFDPELARAARTIRELPDMVALREVFEIGPPGQSIRDEFERVDDGALRESRGGGFGAAAVPVFDSVSGRLRSSLAGEPDAYWRARPAARRRRRAKAGLVESHIRRAGWILLALRAYTHNASVMALCYHEKSLGNGFIPVITPTVTQAKALCVLWNSTPNTLQLLNMRSRKLTYPMWSVEHLASVQVPRSLDVDEVASRLVGVYDRVADTRLQPWCRADTDPIRRAIDESASQAYGISAASVADWRERLTDEPTMANQAAL